MNLINLMNDLYLFSEQYKLPEQFCRKSLIQDIVLWLDEFSDDPDNIFQNTISLILKGIKTDFKYSYKITLSLKN